MAEFIIRLTDEEEQLLRATSTDDCQVDMTKVAPYVEALLDLSGSMMRQAREALATYDRIVAEVKAASDD